MQLCLTSYWFLRRFDVFVAARRGENTRSGVEDLDLYYADGLIIGA